MGKIEKEKLFCFETVSIIIENGEVRKCTVRTETAMKINRNFYEVLNSAMKTLAELNPKLFVKMYKSLNLSTREYKMAKKFRQQYRLD